MITSGFMQVAGFVGRCMACFRTVWNNKTWPTSLKEKLREAAGMEGQILIEQEKGFVARKTRIFAVGYSYINIVLATIVGREDLNNIRALIGTGGFLSQAMWRPFRGRS
jgi:hypothetical protein